jgi:hypothetical protein
VKDDVPVDSESLLLIDFVNLKIKPTQSFECAYRGRVCTCIYRDEYSYIYKYLVYTVFIKKRWLRRVDETRETSAVILHSKFRLLQAPPIRTTCGCKLFVLGSSGRQVTQDPAISRRIYRR